MTKPVYVSREHSEAGFTLLELLVAMTLLGLLMTVLFAGLKFGARAWERGQAHSTEADEIRLAQTLLRRELELAYPYFISDPQRPRIDFSGTADQLSFLGPAPQSLAVGGRARIVLRGEERGGSVALLFEARPELALDDLPGEQEALITGMKAVAFSYYGQVSRDAPPQWVDRWVDQTRLPRLVRISAEFPGRDARLWPDLIVAPRISADVGCLYDVLTNYCRGR